MFPHGYFAAGFFPPGYFPPAVSALGGVGSYPGPIVRDKRLKVQSLELVSFRGKEKAEELRKKKRRQRKEEELILFWLAQEDD